MKKILILGELFSDNLGDGIICGVSRKIFSNYYDVKVLDLSGRMSYSDYSKSQYEFSFSNEEKKYLKYNLKKILYRLGYKKNGKNLSNIVNSFKKQFDLVVSTEHFDAIVFAGGQMFIDTFINQIEYVCEYANTSNIKVIFNSCGVGKLLQEDKVAKILDNECVKYVSLRDGVNSIKVTNKRHLVDTYDVAILTFDTYKKAEIKNILGIGIMFSAKHSVKKQISFWIKLLKKIKKNMVDFKVFTNGSYLDQCFAKFVITKAGFNFEDILLDKPNSPEDLVSVITSFESIISMRLHSLIIAYSYDIPALAISWDDKVKEFFCKIDREDLCYNLYCNKLMDVRSVIDQSKKKYNQNLKKEIINSVHDNLSNIIKEIEK